MSNFTEQEGSGWKRAMKRWRYPGVPIPHRLQHIYSSNPRDWVRRRW